MLAISEFGPSRHIAPPPMSVALEAKRTSMVFARNQARLPIAHHWHRRPIPAEVGPHVDAPPAAGRADETRLSLIGLVLGANLSPDIGMLLHRIFMLVAGAMVALSIFFVFRPHRPIQPPHQLAATACQTRPETSTVPPEYNCENAIPSSPNSDFRP
jgi:hypothetical protein